MGWCKTELFSLYYIVLQIHAHTHTPNKINYSILIQTESLNEKECRLKRCGSVIDIKIGMWMRWGGVRNRDFEI